MKFFGFATVLHSRALVIVVDLFITVLHSRALVIVVDLFILHYGVQFSAQFHHSDFSVFVSIK